MSVWVALVTEPEYSDSKLANFNQICQRRTFLYPPFGLRTLRLSDNRLTATVRITHLR